MQHMNWNELKNAANAGDRDAQFKVASHYFDGWKNDDGRVVVRRNRRLGLKWLRLSAEQGESCAQVNLGVILSDGDGVEKNDEEALRWLKRANRAHDASAATNIGCIYRDQGKHRLAFRWFLRSIEMGDEDSLVEVGKRYLLGPGVRRDYRQALLYLHKATKAEMITESGRDDAFYYLGIAYKDGLGVTKSLLKARKMFERANRDGDHNGAAEQLEQIGYVR